MVATVHPALPDSPSPSDLKTFGRRSRRFVWAKVSGGKTDIVRSEPSKGDQTILHEIFSASDAPAQIERHRRQRSSTVSAAGGPVVPASLDEEARLAALHKPSGLAKRHGRSRSIFFRKNPTSKAGSATAESSAPSGRSRCATEQAQSDMEDAISFGSLASPRSASVTKALRDLEQVSDFVCQCAADVTPPGNHHLERHLHRAAERARPVSMTQSIGRTSFSTLEESSACSSPVSSYAHDLPIVQGVLLPSSMSRPSRRSSAHPSSRICRDGTMSPTSGSHHSHLDYGRETMSILEAGTAPLGHGSLVAPTPLPPRRPQRCARNRTQSAGAASAPSVSSAGFLADREAVMPPPLPLLATISTANDDSRPQSRGGTKRPLASTPPHEAGESRDLSTQSSATELPQLKQGRSMTSTSIGRARSGSASTLANARNMIERTLGGRSRGGSISNEHSTPKTRTRSGSNPLSRLMNRTATPTQSEHEVDPSVANDTPVAPGICTPTFGNMNWSLPPLDTRTAPASHDDMWDALNSSEELTEMLDSESVPRDFGDAENHLTRRSLGLGFDPTGLVA